MKLIEDLKNSDIFNLFAKSSIEQMGEFLHPNIKMTQENLNTLNLIANIKKIKKEQSSGSVSLKSVKDYKDTLENWIYENLDYPVTNLNIYNAMLNTFVKGEEKEVDYLILSFPQQVEKILNYNKNKGIYFKDNALLKEYLNVLSLKDSYHFVETVKQETMNQHTNSVLHKQVNMERVEQSNYKTEQVQVKQGQNASAQQAKPTTSNGNIETKNSYSKYTQKGNRINNRSEESGTKIKQMIQEIDKEDQETIERFKKWLLGCVEALKNDGYSEKADMDKNQLRVVFMNNLKDRSTKSNFEMNKVFKNVVLPVLIETNNEEELNIIVDIIKMADNSKIVANKDFLDANFWNGVGKIKGSKDNFEKLTDTEKEILINKENIILDEFLTKVLKIDEYDGVGNFEMVFNTLSMITRDEEKFRSRLNFFDKLGFSIIQNQMLAKVEKGTRGLLEAKVVLETDKKESSKEIYDKVTVAGLLKRQNNEMWNKVVDPLIEAEKNKISSRRIVGNFKP